MGLSSIELAPFAGVYDLLSVSHGHWPVEALLEHIFNESSWHGVVSTGLAVDVF
jgi:hypothetical protein